MSHPQEFLHPKSDWQHWIVLDIEGLQYWLDPKAIQLPKDQVELFSDRYWIHKAFTIFLPFDC